MMHRPARLVLLLSGFVSSASASDGVNFLKRGLVHESDVQVSMDLAMASAHHDQRGAFASKRSEEIKEQLKTMYTSLPKNAQGKLSHQVVRYALQRFFDHRFGWFIRGIEPSNTTWHANVNPEEYDSKHLKEWVPSYLQDLLERKYGEGADLDELAALAMALEALVRQEAVGRLEASYDMHGYAHDVVLRRADAEEVIITYYVGFLLAGDWQVESPGLLELEKKKFYSEYDGWPKAEEWLNDLLKTELKKAQNDEYTFARLLEVADLIGERYFKFNDVECRDLKETMRSIESAKPGRVRLSSFYQKGMYSHWGFTERLPFLRAMGATDEAEPEQPFVIIANYAMARTNCLDASNIYAICCRNECEDLMSHLEAEIGQATATPERIAELVAGLPSETQTHREVLPPALLSRLDEIAGMHGGQVPLHGRLFAQWMHHAYPIECPFPRQLGAVNSLNTEDWLQSEKTASSEEMLELVSHDQCNTDGSGCGGSELTWDSNEELLTWYSDDSVVRAQLLTELPHQQLSGVLLLAIVALAAAVVAALAGKVERKRWFESVTSKPLVGLGLVTIVAYGFGFLDVVQLALVAGCGCVKLAAERFAWGGRAS